MSVLCCCIPDFLINVTQRHTPRLRHQPFALVGPDERVVAASATGVQVDMSPRQAQLRCPDIVIHPLDLSTCQHAQAAFVDTLAQWELPLEPCGWGMAYIDMQDLSDIKPLATSLGRTVRQVMGEGLQPALGWDSGKFTARVAAVRTLVGHLRLVGKREEVTFLAPLPITLLPLPTYALQQLQWLGIRTLGDFATLPSAAVWQRFGAAGKVVQQWARGRDNRPVYNHASPVPAVISVEFEPPTARLQRVVDACWLALQPRIEILNGQLRGCRRLRLQLTFVTGTRTLDIPFVEATSQQTTIQAALTHHLRTLNWPDALEQAAITLLETRELTMQQMSLLPDVLEQPSLDNLTFRYGNQFLRGQIVDAMHPVAERRSQWQVL